MTKSIDKFLVDHGFDGEELAAVKYRPMLYPAIILAGLTALIFISLIALNWF